MATEISPQCQQLKVGRSSKNSRDLKGADVVTKIQNSKLDAIKTPVESIKVYNNRNKSDFEDLFPETIESVKISPTDLSLLNDLITAGYSITEASKVVLEASTRAKKVMTERDDKRVEGVFDKWDDGRDLIHATNLDQSQKQGKEGKQSFAEVVTGKSLSAEVPPPILVGGNVLIHIDEEERQRRVDANKNSLLGKLHMPNESPFPSTQSLKKRMATVLGFDNFQVMLMGRGFFHIYMNSKEKKDMLLRKGVLNLNPGSIRLTQWVRNFKPNKQSNSSTAQVWVQLHNLPIEYWGANLFNIARGLGVLLRVDEGQNHELFARILVEIDLAKPLQKHLLIKDKETDFFVKIIYERIPDFCEECRMIGHTRLGYKRFAKVVEKLQVCKEGLQEHENTGTRNEKKAEMPQSTQMKNTNADSFHRVEKRDTVCDKQLNFKVDSNENLIESQGKREEMQPKVVELKCNNELENNGAAYADAVSAHNTKSKQQEEEPAIQRQEKNANAGNNDIVLTKVWNNLNAVLDPDATRLASLNPSTFANSIDNDFEQQIQNECRIGSVERKNSSSSALTESTESYGRGKKFPNQASEARYNALKELGLNGIYDSASGMKFTTPKKWGDMFESEEDEMNTEKGFIKVKDKKKQKKNKTIIEGGRKDPPLTRSQAEQLRREARSM